MKKPARGRFFMHVIRGGEDYLINSIERVSTVVPEMSW